jgi:23S rRNA (cytosine1962-C5)-methyltransferase
LALEEGVVRQVCEEAVRQLNARAVYRKVFPKDRTAARQDLNRLHCDPTPWIGEPVEPEVPVREAGITFRVRPYDGYATGLFLDHRAQRELVRRLAHRRRVLNTFAYTCAFTVAAALGGATETVSVDVSRKYLEWGKRNLAANGIGLGAHRFICSDVFDYYRRAARQGQGFDLVILDPPTFGRSRAPQRVFALTEDLDRLIGGALPMLGAGGRLLLSVNHRGTTLHRLEDAVGDAARTQGRTVEALEHPAPPEDFRSDPEAAKSILVRLR